MRRRFVPLLLAASICVIATVPANAKGDTQHRAGVVVRISNTDIRKACVFFESPTITGLELLQRSGIAHQVKENPLGTAVCRIGGTGCSPSGDCFCDYPVFWGYWVRNAGQATWRFSNVGARDRRVLDGSIDGWSWGRDGKPPPPQLSFDEACPTSARPTTFAASTVRPASGRTLLKRPNYLPFVAFVGAFVALAVLAALVRRRRLAGVGRGSEPR